MKSSLLGRGKWVLIPLIFLLLVVGRILTVKKTVPVMGIERIQEEKGVPVDVTTIEKRDLSAWESFSGTVKGIRQGTIRANAANVIEEVHRRVGDWVKKDQVVVSLDPNAPQMGLSRYHQAKANYENAEREVGRLEPLLEEGAISESEMDQARTALENARAEWMTVRSEVDLEAPISGVLTFLGVEPGERVEPGRLIATIADINQVRVILQVSEERARLIKVGQPARVPGIEEKGEVRRISMSADPRTRLFEVEVVIDNEAGLLRPETIADVEIAVDSRSSVAALPEDALFRMDGGWRVFLVKDGRAELRPVEVGLSDGEFVEITSGLETGDRVVTYGQNRLRGGEKVLIHRER
jgi:membrane fusion protein (multidrug efflux system)